MANRGHLGDHIGWTIVGVPAQLGLILSEEVIGSGIPRRMYSVLVLVCPFSIKKIE